MHTHTHTYICMYICWSWVTDLGRCRQTDLRSQFSIQFYAIYGPANYRHLWIMVKEGLILWKYMPRQALLRIYLLCPKL